MLRIPGAYETATSQSMHAAIPYAQNFGRYKLQALTTKAYEHHKLLVSICVSIPTLQR